MHGLQLRHGSLVPAVRQTSNILTKQHAERRAQVCLNNYRLELLAHLGQVQLLAVRRREQTVMSCIHALFFQI